MPHVDILLYDLKEIDVEKHRRFTGAGNEKILANAVFAARFKEAQANPKALWIRTPVIPGATDTTENIGGIGDFIHARLHGTVDRWELCAFNNLCRDKYQRLDMNWAFADRDLPEKSQMEELTRVAQGRVKPSSVCWSGSTRLNGNSNKKFAAKTDDNNQSIPNC